MKKEKQNIKIQLDCHPGSLLAGVSLGQLRKGNEQAICIGKQAAGDPGQKPSGMTTNFNSSPLTRRNASPSPSWRGGTNNPLPPGGGRCPVRADEGEQAFPARSVIPTLRAATNARYSGHSGFSLIELLVVVLIIGILAAVALPQYQRALLKTKYTQLYALTRTIANAQELHYLTHSRYATRFDELDLGIGGSPDNPTTDTSHWVKDTVICVLSANYASCRDTSTLYMSSLIHYRFSASGDAGRHYCIVYGSDAHPLQTQICQEQAARKAVFSWYTQPL